MGWASHDAVVTQGIILISQRCLRDLASRLWLGTWQREENDSRTLIMLKQNHWWRDLILTYSGKPLSKCKKIRLPNIFSGDTISLTGAKHPESTETKMDNFRKHLLIITISVTIITYAFTCICFIYYYFTNDNAPKAGR